MKKIFLSLLTIGILALPMVGLAVTPTEPPERTGQETIDVLDTVMKYVYAVFLVVAVICFIIGGFYFITSAGDPEKVGKGRSFVLYGVIGVIIAVLARGLIALAKLIVGVGA